MKSGLVILRDGVVLPKSVPLQTASYASGWRAVLGHDNISLDRKLKTVGWSLVSALAEVKSISFGRHGEQSVQRTVNKVLAKIAAQHFNCASLSSISSRRILGIPYTLVSGQAFNMQHGSRLQSLSRRQHGEFGAGLRPD